MKTSSPLIAAVIGTVLLCTATTSCQFYGSSVAADMSTDDIVNGMTRDQIYWMLGEPEATESVARDGQSTNYYTIRGQRWQCVFEGDTLISHGPAA